MKTEMKKPRILIVDDRAADRELMEFWFKSVAEVSLAKNSAEAFAKLAGQDIILVDYKLGQENGIEVARSILEKRSDVLLRLMTGVPVSRYDPFDTSIQCIEKTVDLQPIVDTVMHLWRTQCLKGDFKEKRDEIIRLLPFKDRIRRVYRTQIPGLESLVGRPRGSDQEIKWVIYRDPAKPVIRIGVTPTLGCVGGCLHCFSGKTRPFIKRFGATAIICQVLLALESIWATGFLTEDFAISVDFTCEGDFISNAKNVSLAIKMMAAVKQLNIVSFIITTIGNIKVLREFNQDCLDLPVIMYWSLHTTNPAKREWLLPRTKGQSLDETAEVFRERFLKTGQRPTAAISVFKGFNDTEEETQRFIDFFRKYPWFDVKVSPGVNFSLPWHPVTSVEDALNLVTKLRSANINVRYRDILGTGIMAGCGTTTPPPKKRKTKPRK